MSLTHSVIRRTLTRNHRFILPLPLGHFSSSSIISTTTTTTTTTSNYPTHHRLPITSTSIPSQIRSLHSTSTTMSDQYTAKSEQPAPLPQRISEVEAIIKSIGTSMLTTTGTDGNLHSRAMRDASHDGLIFKYIYDNTSHKDDEIHQNSHVNISFLEPTGGDWISISGTATTTSSPEEVKKVWSPDVKAWFGDLGDGKDGSETDPRVSVVVVKPHEIRYFTRQKNLVSQAIDIATSAVSGSVAKPGSIRTITGDEIKSL